MKISSILDLQKITNSIKKILLPGDVIFLYGQIGAGKTTFVRLLINNYENEKKLKKSDKKLVYVKYFSYICIVSLSSD